MSVVPGRQDKLTCLSWLLRGELALLLLFADTSEGHVDTFVSNITEQRGTPGEQQTECSKQAAVAVGRRKLGESSLLYTITPLIRS